MSKQLQTILSELYELDPSFQDHEKELKKIIKLLLQEQPSITLDKQFVQELKTTLMEETSPTESSPKAPWFYGLTGGLVTFAVVALAYVATTSFPTASPVLESTSIASLFGRTTTNLEPGAFGELQLNPEAAADLKMAISSQTVGYGGGGGGGDTSNLTRESMIAPNPVQYTYVYDGDDLNLTEEMGQVYVREVKGIQPPRLARALQQEDFGLFDINTFSALQLKYLEVAEDRNNGLIMNIQFKEEQISFYQNWDKWNQQESSPLNISQMPSDQELLAIAQDFVEDHNIDTQAYGAPFVDRTYEQWLYTDTAGITYAPESVSVWYPLLLNGETVYESYGGYYGLNIQVHTRYKLVSGASNIQSQNYLSSDYALETDAARIIRLAESGGSAPVFFRQEGVEQREITLGTPQRVYLRQFLYENNQNTEYYVPALRFPVQKTGNEEGYLPESVTIPLVQDFLDDLEAVSPPDIEPIPLPEPLEEPTDLPVDGPVLDGPIPVEPDGGIGNTTTSLDS